MSSEGACANERMKVGVFVSIVVICDGDWEMHQANQQNVPLTNGFYHRSSFWKRGSCSERGREFMLNRSSQMAIRQSSLPSNCFDSTQIS